jgi:hypothetical protein
LSLCAVSAAQLPPVRQLYGEGFGVQTPYGDIPQAQYNQMKTLGISYVRRDVNWETTEPLPDVYNWSHVDKLVNGVISAGMKPILILAYGNRQYSGVIPRTPFVLEKYSRFCKRVVERYKDRGILWEIWNEPNHTYFWPPAPNAAEYATMFKSVSQAIRTYAPNEYIMAPGLSGFDFPFVEELFQRGILQYVNGISVHPYRIAAPEDAIEDFAQMRILIDRYRPKNRSIDLFTSEWGYPITARNPALDQERYVARKYFVGLLSGAPVTIHYNWSNTGFNQTDPENTYGLLTKELVPKKAFQKLRFYQSELAGYRFVSRLELGNNDHFALLFSNGSAEKVVAWNAVRTTKEILIPAMNGVFDARRQLGTPITLSAAGGNLRFPITDDPAIVVPRQRNLLWNYVAKVPGVPAWSVWNDSHEMASTLLDMMQGLKAPGLPALSSVSIVDTEEGTEAASVKKIERGQLSAAPTISEVEPLVRSLPVCRNWGGRPHQVIISLKIGSLPLWKFRTRVFKVSPLAGAIEPRSSTVGTDFVISNPALTAFSGTLRMTYAGKMAERKVTIPAGKAWVAVPTPATPAELRNYYRFSLLDDSKTYGDEERTVLSTGTQRVVFQEDFNPYPLGKAIEPYVNFVSPVGGGAWSDVQCVLAPAGMPFVNVKTLRLTYNFATRDQAATVTLKKPKVLQGKPLVLTMWVYGTGAKPSLITRIWDKDKQYHQAKPLVVDWVGWRYVTVNIFDDFAAVFGGTGHPRMDYPASLYNFLVVSPGATGSLKGQVFIANLAIHAAP